MRHKLDIHPVPEEVLYINELSLAENVPYGFIYSPSVEIYNLTENIYRGVACGRPLLLIFPY